MSSVHTPAAPGVLCFCVCKPSGRYHQSVPIPIPCRGGITPLAILSWKAEAPWWPPHPTTQGHTLTQCLLYRQDHHMSTAVHTHGCLCRHTHPVSSGPVTVHTTVQYQFSSERPHVTPFTSSLKRRGYPSHTAALSVATNPHETQTHN
jgi:hypothetical protein